MKLKLIYIWILFAGLIITGISCGSHLWPNSGYTPELENLHVNEDLDYSKLAFNQFINDTRENKTHYVTVLRNGDDALLARLHVIRNAQKSILVQVFIWGADESGRFVAYELFQAAKRGVKVKILLDCFTLPKDPQLIAYLTMVHPNIEIKIYNPVSRNIVSSKLVLIKKAFLQFRNLNQRMHNKVLIVDDRIGIVGGRNYENDYFDRGLKRNFTDCDVLVISPIVGKMTDSFMQYWAYPLSISSRDMQDVKRLIEAGKYKKYSSEKSFVFGDLFREVEECESNQGCLQRRLVDVSYKVEKIDFVVDKPGKNSRLGKNKDTKTTYELGRFLQQAKESIVIQTPYLIVGRKGTKYFKKLARDNPDLEFLVSTNSLASADHTHAYAFSYKNKKKYLKDFRWQIFELKLKPQDADLMVSPINKKKRSKEYITCLHSKIYIVDSKKVWIGSFNLDPRSANLNTEVGVIIEDERVAKDLEAQIRRDMAKQNSWTIAKRKQLPVISHFSGLMANLMRLIPVIDIWPFTYSGSYELKPDEVAVPFFHKDFYKRYKYVGPFPDVKLTEKEIKARLIKSFLGPMESLL